MASRYAGYSSIWATVLISLFRAWRMQSKVLGEVSAGASGPLNGDGRSAQGALPGHEPAAEALAAAGRELPVEPRGALSGVLQDDPFVAVRPGSGPKGFDPRLPLQRDHARVAVPGAALPE